MPAGDDGVSRPVVTHKLKHAPRRVGHMEEAPMSDLLTVDSKRFTHHEIEPGEVAPGLVRQAPALREIFARLPTYKAGRS